VRRMAETLLANPVIEDFTVHPVDGSGESGPLVETDDSEPPA
jgi:hypothetical protein